ncbi:MAG: DNA repair protein RecN [Coriobacteriales bacterium]|jgi:DNA repair protein RecN (Recombination protein N)
MLDELHVHDLALIEDAMLAFSEHLTVLTGETGAGKTALLSALKLISGQRADSQMVRDGSEEATAEARLVDEDGEEHVIRRRLSARGRSRCSVDGAMATVGELAQRASSIHIHGQHEQVQLLDSRAQLGYLDSWISATGEHLEAYRAARSAYLAAAERLEHLESAQATASKQLEFYRFTDSEISKVSPVQGEYDELESEVRRLQNSEELASSLESAFDALNGDGCALDQVARAEDSLARLAGIDPDLDALGSELSGLQASLEDFARDLHAYGQTVQHDPGRLEDALTRLDELSGLMKRYGPGMEQVFATWDEAKRALADADASPERLEAARERTSELKRALEKEAAALSARRHEAASELCDLLADSVHELSMEGAGFEFGFEELPFERWSEAGPEQVELRYRPSAASQARPLSRIASGGELSRILLALECVRSGADEGVHGRTLVFDEVDQGIGGATGAAVARRLAELAQSSQVIVVTHLPQVAACADRHFVVSKHGGASGLPITIVEPVTGEERVAEIARMLSGKVDEAALEHARSLIEDAGGKR